MPEEFLVMMRLWETLVPIPNTAVKPQAADGTWLETARESRTPPDSKVNRPPLFRGGRFVLMCGYYRTLWFCTGACAPANCSKHQLQKYYKAVWENLFMQKIAYYFQKFSDFAAKHARIAFAKCEIWQKCKK